MSIHIIKKEHQARGEFNGGEILENKPLGFPREGGELKPYSNLFYWSHAWSDQGSTIGLHPHQVFEIMSFVVEGSIEHYDSAYRKWIPLNKGAAQIIRAGKGISHSEKINPGGHMFQIWFDPDITKTIQKEASYNDYPHEAFPIIDEDGIKTKVYRGEGSPLEMDTEGVEIYEKWIGEGEHKLSLNDSKIYSIYLVKGELELDAGAIQSDDFFIVKAQGSVQIKSHTAIHLFLVAVPSELNYKTYSQNLNNG